MKKSLFIIALVAIIISSCTDAGRAKLTNFGNEFKVEMYSGGLLVKTWISSGKVRSENNSDGYYFVDKSTGKLVEVSGDVVITNLN